MPAAGLVFAVGFHPVRVGGKHLRSDALKHSSIKTADLRNLSWRRNAAASQDTAPIGHTNLSKAPPVMWLEFGVARSPVT